MTMKKEPLRGAEQRTPGRQLYERALAAQQAATPDVKFLPWAKLGPLERARLERSATVDRVFGASKVLREQVVEQVDRRLARTQFVCRAAALLAYAGVAGLVLWSLAGYLER